MNDMKKMKASEMRTRIREIENLQHELEQRDFDAELSKVMLAGGDIDALEEKQLEAERTIRRLRVEKQALESLLPQTTQIEVTAEIEALKKSCENDVDLMNEQIDLIESAFNETLKPALAKLLEIQIKRNRAEHQARQLVTMHKLDYRIPSHFRELYSRRLKLIKMYVNAGRKPESDILPNIQYIEDK
ncbi:hypothetical protein [Vibrio alginolyticus]|uniref:hypothetical protein n=1 Tax=Vibrio alginolyticus TaxID=663 RepID=UPI00211A6E15|nr:hypothetical protein [Vibrio alginolyticus]MCQ9090564.1 hypothetical protein [Vibrio alginolyticus]